MAFKCAKRGRFAYFALKLALMGQISELIAVETAIFVNVR
jgi:hypothetical protein